MHAIIDIEAMKQVEAMAAKSFADHEVTELAPGRMWRCQKPGTITYSFTVAFMPGGFIVIAGDVGDVILRHSDRDSMRWLRGSVSMPEYIFGKAQPVCRESTTEFSPEMAWQEIKQHKFNPISHDDDCSFDDVSEDSQCTCGIESLRQEAIRIEELWDGESEHSFHQAYHEVTNDCEFPTTRVFSPHALWMLMCLRKFVELVDAPKEGTES